MGENFEITGKITLKELRNISGETQLSFSQKVGIPLTTYRRYEKDTSKMDVGTLFKVCEKFGIDASKLRI